MSIFYVFVVNDPNKVGTFPPSFNGSEYALKIGSYLSENAASIQKETTYTNIFQFASLTDLNNWLAEYKLNDAGLLSDLNTWKTTHNISFNSYYFDTANSTPITGPVS